jgi:hypothetical protein
VKGSSRAEIDVFPMVEIRNELVVFSSKSWEIDHLKDAEGDGRS